MDRFFLFSLLDSGGISFRPLQDRVISDFVVSATNKADAWEIATEEFPEGSILFVAEISEGEAKELCLERREYGNQN